MTVIEYIAVVMYLQTQKDLHFREGGKYCEEVQFYNTYINYYKNKIEILIKNNGEEENNTSKTSE